STSVYSMTIFPASLIPLLSKLPNLLSPTSRLHTAQLKPPLLTPSLVSMLADPITTLADFHITPLLYIAGLGTCLVYSIPCPDIFRLQGARGIDLVLACGL
ncbi:30277_t:CDS:2, partial [Racocetra persica]